MFNPKLLNYLEALNLEPLWLKKEIATPFFSNSLVSTKLIESTSISHLIQSAKIENKLNPQKGGTSFKQNIHNNCLHQNKNHSQELEIIARIQLFLFKNNKQSILIAFLSSKLNQKNNPFHNTPYARMLGNLFKQLQINLIEMTLIKENNIENIINSNSINKALLFSKQFENSQLLKNLQQKGVSTIVLEHPLNLLRNPMIKKSIWLKLEQFF